MQRGRLCRLFALPFAHVLKIALEKVVQKSTNHCDRSEPPNRLPTGRDGRLDNVGRELEREASHQPPCITQPNIAPIMAGDRRERRRQRGNESLQRAEGDDQPVLDRKSVV